MPDSTRELPVLKPLPGRRILTAWPRGTPQLTREVRPLPMSAAECRARGWQELDVVFVTGDAYVDHPSFAMAILGRVLEAHGFRVARCSVNPTGTVSQEIGTATDLPGCSLQSAPGTWIR